MRGGRVLSSKLKDLVVRCNDRKEKIAMFAAPGKPRCSGSKAVLVQGITTHPVLTSELKV
jgi:hypothetical protein